LAQAVAPRAIRIERPRGEAPSVPKRIEAQPKAPVAEVAGAAGAAGDDLEIPAFLRRRAN
ncbi:MAG TPA: hypothetical protein VI390_08535, partial [Methyloceanibacter sp.]